MISYHVFQFTVLAQPFLWMWLYDSPVLTIRESFKDKFATIGLCAAALIYKTGFSVAYYTTSILIQYIIMTLLATYIYNLRYDIKQAICLAFLTVYLNSFYWESPLHLAEIIEYHGLRSHMLPQFLRLTPVLFFASHYTFNAGSVKLLASGYFFSYIVLLLKKFSYRVLHYVAYHNHATMMVRFVCMVVLVTAIMEAEKKCLNG